MDAAITLPEFQTLRAAFPPPQIIDVRRTAAFERDPEIIDGALRCAPEDVAALAATLEPWRPTVVYCVHGHEVSQDAAAALRERGYAARYLDSGLEGWRAGGGTTRAWTAPTRWVTRERPKIDRIACPWLIRRFLDPAALFFYVPNAEVRSFAAAQDATPYDIPDVTYSHHGDECSFDAFVRIHSLASPPLDRLAMIVRGADTDALALAPQASGLLAVSLGLSRAFADDHAMLRWGLLVYDALYVWCREAQGERHGWNPDALRTMHAPG